MNRAVGTVPFAENVVLTRKPGLVWNRTASNGTVRIDVYQETVNRAVGTVPFAENVVLTRKPGLVWAWKR
ncbi:MAG TPA: hypothetical protein VK752_24305 [Bryobacteraceae bacterium]|nr:hypothetical protein [Bryobacteraceae bacterium]